jgi:hypothetical protein
MARKSQPASSVSIAPSTPGAHDSLSKSTLPEPRAAKESDRSWKKSQVQRGKPLKTAPPSPLALRMQQASPASRHGRAHSKILPAGGA